MAKVIKNLVHLGGGRKDSSEVSKVIFFKPWILITIILIAYLLPKINLNIPITLQEAKEGYNAYSLFKIYKDTNGGQFPLFFRTDNNYISTLSVYLRVPIIALFGLNNFSVRIPNLFVGIICIFSFYLVNSLFFKKKWEILLATFLFGLSPLFVKIAYFDLGATLGITLSLLALYFLIKEKYKYFIATLIISIFSTFPATLFIVVILLSNHFLKKKIKFTILLIFGLVFVLTITFKFQPELAKYLKRQTIINDLLPTSYTYIIDKRLSFGKIYGSPLVRKNFDFNRIAHNKLFYFTNELAASFIRPFNFEKLISPFQSQTILANESLNLRNLPALYVWELPIIIIGLVILIKKRQNNLSLIFAGLVTAIFFKDSQYVLLPTVIICEVVFISRLLNKFKHNSLIFLKSGLIIIYALSYFSFFDLFYNHYNVWISENDLRQHQIWSYISPNINNFNKIFVTDRVGEPVYYYLYYNKIDPNLFLGSRHIGPEVDGGIIRINSVGTTFFGSFKYYEFPRGKNEVWVGMIGEFVGEKKNYDGYITVTDGDIVDKISGVRTKDKLIGDTIWIVKTKSK